jgi:hypothetical protein
LPLSVTGDLIAGSARAGGDASILLVIDPPPSRSGIGRHFFIDLRV